MREWLLRIAIAFDQMVQAMFRFGIPGETISARAGKARRRGKTYGCLLCWLLDALNPGHCERAIRNDIARAKAVIDDLTNL